jgi:hypothetical protein
VHVLTFYLFIIFRGQSARYEIIVFSRVSDAVLFPQIFFPTFFVYCPWFLKRWINVLEYSIMFMDLLGCCWSADFSHAWTDRKITNMKCEYAWCMLQVYPGYMYKVCHLPILPTACKNSPVHINTVFCILLYIIHLIYYYTFLTQSCCTVNFSLSILLKLRVQSKLPHFKESGLFYFLRLLNCVIHLFGGMMMLTICSEVLHVTNQSHTHATFWSYLKGYMYYNW